MSDVRFDGKVALVTGAGGGLGKSHALLLAARGAKVVVNDIGGALSGEGRSQTPAQDVVDEILASGGQAIANYDSVTLREGADSMVASALDRFGRLDILINNAGILRDKSFHKLEESDWDRVLEVHLKGAFNVTQSAWPGMRERGYGRIIMTSSGAGLYGNFGQAPYSAAKMALAGLGRTLAMEGAKYNLHTNIIAPVARSRMTETILSSDLLESLGPELVSPLVAWLCHEACETNGAIYEIGGGMVTRLEWARSKPFAAGTSEDFTPEALRDAWDRINDMSEGKVCKSFQESLRQLLAVATGKS